LQLFLISLAVSLGINLLLFLLAYMFQTDKLTDISYSLTFILLSVWLYFIYSDNSPLEKASLVLILIWAVRLGSYLFIRIHKMGADHRFDSIRNNFISFLGFWVMQGLTVPLVLLSFIILIAQGQQTANLLTGIGLLVATVAVVIEGLADYQKYIFKQKHPDAFMQSGLWSYIRHPNYTGEILFWIGIAVITASMIDGLQPQLINLISPLWIIIILVFFSGIPPLEKSWIDKYGHLDAYQKYKKRSWRLLPFVY